jgi:hypothetical protein
MYMLYVFLNIDYTLIVIYIYIYIYGYTWFMISLMLTCDDIFVMLFMMSNLYVVTDL